MLLFIAFALGFTAGLRSMTPLALLAWTAHDRLPGVAQSAVAFMASVPAKWVLGVFALVELCTDKLPFTPSRLATGPLAARVLSGALCGVVVQASAGAPLLTGAIVGVAGAVVGSFAGYRARHALVAQAGYSDLLIAVLEDIVTIGAGLFLVSRL
jgi:uncharacterized membrane protein